MTNFTRLHRFWNTLFIIVLFMLVSENGNAQNSGFGNQIILGDRTASNISGLKVVDVDQDGYPDILISSENQISWFQNLKNGQFGPVNLLVETDVNIKGFDVGDATGDGNIDLVWFHAYNGGFFIQQGIDDLSDSEIRQIEYAEESRLLRDIKITKQPEDEQPILFISDDFGIGTVGSMTLSMDSRSNSESLNIQYTELLSGDSGQPSGKLWLADMNGDQQMDLIMADNHYIDNSQIGVYLEQTDGNHQFTEVAQYGYQKVTDIAIGDMNSNGKPDIVSGTEIYTDIMNGNHGYSGHIYFHENLGEGNFSEPIVLESTFEGFSFVELIDVDQNGMKDIVAVTRPNSFEPSKIVWMKNEGGGNFSDSQLLAESTTWYDVMVAADITMDGQLDLIGSSSLNDELAWFEYSDDLMWDRTVIEASDVSSPVDLISFDVDGDGLNDLIVSSEQHEKGLVWYRNLGNFQFSPPIIIDDSMENVLQIEMYDVDGSGQDDLVVLSSRWYYTYQSANDNPLQKERKREFTLAWYKIQGSVDFDDASIIASGEYEGDHFSMGDFNGNGHLDVAVTILSNEMVLRMDNQGDGQFAEPVVVGAELTGANVNVAADLNGDGNDELIIISRERDEDEPVFNNVFNFWLNRFDDGEHLPVKFQLDELRSTHAVRTMKSADLNLNGRPEIVAATTSWTPNNLVNQYLIVMEQTDIDSVWHQTNLSSSGGAGYEDLYIADLNQNGLYDVVSISNVYRTWTDALNGDIHWYENVGEGVFAERKTIDSSVIGMKNVIAADLNNNGLRDIVITVINKDGSRVNENEPDLRDYIAIYPNVMNESVSIEPVKIPDQFQLHQNYPNPFNPSTLISYTISEAGFVELNVFNLLGQKIQVLVSEQQTAGSHHVRFNAGNLSSGVYLYQLKTGNTVINRKMLLVK
ncbi:T9SS C-terminal target domain-containing protein [Rhodohalobacter sp. SW132]|uniref:T9SS type A sorting domain-containing protein n=1 Tax=Rhodohalobacter sp. SW132 TaxID=2293433 RepID=UPI000E271EDB|nr:T9SS type A sorting domain-containing protein [Rhodohalobacter sp. SW132]REL33470.1 T9SS C-terminal target domain-containing protein [Rhodohalobacter sp. SW132]